MKQKIGIVGGLVLVGGAAAYALTSASAATDVPTGPQVDPRAAKQAECDALQTRLAALRAQATPDRASMTQLETQLAACLAQAREAGVPVDPSIAHMSEGDASKAQMDQWFAEYKATSEHDPLKRNNTRQSILAAGTALAGTYRDALTQSPNVETTKLIAQSLVQAIDSSITRKLCFLSNERGCGTFAVNEDQPDAKAAQEQERVLGPLVDAYMQAVTKVGGPSRALAMADGERFLTAMRRQCEFQKVFIDGQFSHYRSTEWSDALKRNNTRQTILAAGRDLVACLQRLFATASSFGSLPTLRSIGTLTIAALNASIDRWRCFFMNERGCGTFAVNEDQPDAKAAQEMANTTVPLMNLYAQIAAALVARGDVGAFEPLVTAKLRVCSTLMEFVDGQFRHYKATDYSDALKRNNTRQTMLATGAALATCLQDTLSTALSANRTAPTSPAGTAGLLGLGGYTGLGQAAPQLFFGPITVKSVKSIPTTMFRPRVDVTKMVRQIAPVVERAMKSAVDRKLCYLTDQPGCGRFGLNEDHGNDKAAQEQERVINPLTIVFKNVVAADPGNLQAEVPLMKSLMREVEMRRDYLNTKFNELKGVNYTDFFRRNNIRDALIASGRDMVAGYRNIRPTTAAGRAYVRSSAQVALQKSQEREACYRSGASGCDRWGWSEPTGPEKADQELAEITNPLRALLADRSKNGLGDASGEPAGISGYTWLGIGAVALVAAGAYSASQRKVRRNRRGRRTSRRLSA